MITAALLLAAAVLAVPSSRGHARVARRRVRWAARAELMAGAAAAAVAMFLVPPTTVVAAALLVGTLWLRRRTQSVRHRARREGRSLADALELLTAELRVGAHPVHAFATAAAETSGPVGAGLRAVAARAGLGADVVAGLRAAGRHSGLPGQWERLAACWQLANDQGLPIGLLMRAAQLDIGERHRYAAQVDAGMAGARATAAILAALPVLGVVLGELLGAAPLRFLSDGAGGWVLVVGVTLLCAGVLWSGRITDRLPA